MTADETFERPWARVMPSTPLASTPHGARHRELRQSFNVLAHPTEGINPESSYYEAQRIEVLLLDAFAGGIDETLFRPSERRHPMRIPLFDYSGVSLREAATEAERVGVMRVIEPPTLNSFPDPANHAAYIVACDLRLQWSEGIAPPVGEPVEEIEIDHVP